MKTKLAFSDQPSVISFLASILCFLTSALCLPAFAQGTAFTYQGRLNSGAALANGSYDVAFTLFATNIGGVAIADPVTNSATLVSNGLFMTAINFGAGVFTGSSNWLELAVRTNGGSAFTTLTPRQQLTPTPYAVYAANSGSAATATAAASAGSVSAANITGALTMSQLPAGVITNGAGGVNLSGTFSGGIGAVTNLNLSRLGSGGGGVNRLRFNDTTGSEQVYLGAAKNLDMETVNDATFWAGHDFTETVDHDFTFHVKHDETVTVDNNLNAVTHGSEALTVDNNLSVVTHGSATLTVDHNLSIAAGTSLAILAPGGVGIGTANPGAPLQIGDTTTPNSQGMMRFASRSGTGISNRYWDIGVPEGDENVGGKFYSFVIDDPLLGTAPEFLIRWDSGNVGINKTNPASKLDVVGSATGNAIQGTCVNLGASGVYGENLTGGGFGVAGRASTSGYAVYGDNVNAAGWAGYFNGNVRITGTLNPASDRNVKRDFAAVNPQAVLAKVAALPIQSWSYTNDSSGSRHLGPVAQDFKAAFGLGADDKTIATVDADGVALAAIQGLNQKVEFRGQKSEDRIQKLETENAELKQTVNELKKLINVMNQKLNGSVK